jgi:hypothetical protein
MRLYCQYASQAFYRVLCLNALCCVLALPLQAQSIFLQEDFEAGLPSQWMQDPMRGMQARGFVRLKDADGNHCLRGQSDNSFAIVGVNHGLLEKPLAVQEYPIFGWRWKVSRVLEGADARIKQKDDFSARFFVVFEKRSWRPRDIRALIYVWDNRQLAGTIMDSMWGKGRVKLVVLRSGVQQAGQWVAEERDVYHDFKRAFPNEEPGSVQAFAIACDTDQTGEAVSTSFDDLIIRRD